LISYEEYHPYGTTAFQAGRSVAEVHQKRYRYTGKERDEETGFTYHGARYYAPWLGRWSSVDPNFESYLSWSPYNYGLNNPLILIDPDGKDVVVIFRGGVMGNEKAIKPDQAGTAGKLDTKLREIAKDQGLEFDSIIIEPGLGSKGSVKTSSKFIKEKLGIGERLRIRGHAYCIM